MLKIPSLDQISAKLNKTVKRFPLPVLFAAITAGIGIMMIGDYKFLDEAWNWKLLMTSVLGTIFLTALTLAAEKTSNTQRSVIMCFGVACLGIYWWSLQTVSDPTQSMVFRFIFLSLASLIGLFWAPFWKQKIDNLKLWHWVYQVGVNFIVTIFFAVVLFAGTGLAVWAIGALFGVDIDERLYGYIWVLCAALFSPVFFLAQLDQDPEKIKTGKSVNKFMKVFTKYIMSPITLGYLLILYTYTLKVLFATEWPKGVLGWLVICFLGVSIFTYFLWTPLLKKTWEKYHRLFWLILLPQIVLLFMAISVRIQAYSWTENRYFVVVLGFWLLGTTLYFLLQKQARFKWVFLSLSVLIFFTQIGPLNGYSISKKAQTSRLMENLTALKVLENGQIVKLEARPNTEQEDEISSILEYLENRHGVDYLKNLFPSAAENFVKKDIYESPESQLMSLMGLKYRTEWERRSNVDTQDLDYSYSISYDAPRQISGYDWRLKPTYQKGGSSVAAGGIPIRYSVLVNQKEKQLTFYDRESVLGVVFVGPYLDQINTDLSRRVSGNVDPERMKFNYEDESLSVLVYVTHLRAQKNEIKHFESEVYLRVKE